MRAACGCQPSAACCTPPHTLIPPHHPLGGAAGVFSPQDAVDYARRELGLGKGVKQTCNRLIYEAIRERKCKDNCTVMLVAFGC